MTNLMTELLCNNKEKITESFVTKFAMEKVSFKHSQGTLCNQEANLCMFCKK